MRFSSLELVAALDGAARVSTLCGPNVVTRRRNSCTIICSGQERDFFKIRSKVSAHARMCKVEVLDVLILRLRQRTD